MKKLILVKPSEEYIDSIISYRQEFLDDGGHFNGDSGLRKFEDINAWIEQCCLKEHRETVPNPDWVEAEQFMLVYEGENYILGMINFRHYLNDYLAEYAGHIGYGVRPSERKKGYAKAMLNLCLEKCRERGLDKILITCDEDNEASRRTIIAGGGVFDRIAVEGDNKVNRYWISLLPKFVYGTSNPAKLKSMRDCLAPLGIKIVGLKETDIAVPEVNENGNTPPQNARIKALAYYKAFNRPVFACDSGLYIDGLADEEQPGVHVRMVGGKRLNDDEMVAHYAAIAGRLGGKAVARYKNAICLVLNENVIYEHFGDDISGNAFCIVDKPHPKRIEGFPLDCISVHVETGEYYYWHNRDDDAGMMFEGFQKFFSNVLVQNNVIHHYDALVDENNDPVHDPDPLKAHMNKWDGELFIEAMKLTPDKSVLEIGVGTGRLAVRVCDKCKSFTGIDIAPKTIERAGVNLKGFPNANLVCADFLTHEFNKTFDVIYSSLTFMHIKNKKDAVNKTASLLNNGGMFVLSINKNRQTEIDYGNRKIQVYPDTSEEISSLLTEAGLIIEKQFETEFAVIFVAKKG